MSKWLSIELSLLLLVSVVALAGLVSTNFGSDEESFDGDDLSGYATATSNVLETGVFNGYPTKIITIPANSLVSKISGRTCFNHKKTGSIYGFRALAKTSGIVVWRKELGQFGGKGNECQPINLDIIPAISPETIEIQGYLVKGSPNAYNSIFEIEIKQKIQQSAQINFDYTIRNSNYCSGDELPIAASVSCPLGYALTHYTAGIYRGWVAKCRNSRWNQDSFPTKIQTVCVKQDLLNKLGLRDSGQQMTAIKTGPMPYNGGAVATSYCNMNDEVAIGGYSACTNDFNPGTVVNTTIAWATGGTWGNDPSKLGTWVTACRGIVGEARSHALCIKKDKVKLRVSNPSTAVGSAVAYCNKDEIAIAGLGRCVSSNWKDSSEGISALVGLPSTSNPSKYGGWSIACTKGIEAQISVLCAKI